MIVRWRNQEQEFVVCVAVDCDVIQKHMWIGFVDYFRFFTWVKTKKSKEDMYHISFSLLLHNHGFNYYGNFLKSLKISISEFFKNANQANTTNKMSERSHQRTQVLLLKLAYIAWKLGPRS